MKNEELLSKLFLEKAESFGITRTAPFKEVEQNFRNFLDYVHETGGWVVAQIGDENQTKQQFYGYTLVVFRYQIPHFTPDVKSKMILAIPDEFAMRAVVLGYLP